MLCTETVRNGFLAFGLLCVSGCSTNAASPKATIAAFDLSADLSKPEAFYDAPYPSDLRLTPQGTPDLTGLPFPSFVDVLDGLRKVAMEHPGFPVVPVAYFRFSAKLAPADAAVVIAADAQAPLLLIDVDATSDERGKLFPLVAATPEVDPYVPENLLSLAPRPGIVLHAKRTYAFVVMRALNDAAGHALGSSPVLDDLRGGRVPAGAQGQAAKTLFDPLWVTLATAGIAAENVAAATVFTTGDVVQELATLSTAIARKFKVTIDDLKVDADDGASHPRYCELVGSVTFPQFQRGKPPFDTEGLFDLQADGLPKKQRDEKAPITITLPRGEMPKAGFPLVTYFHGSGGLSTAVVDRGTWRVESDATKCPEHALEDWLGKKGCNTKGEGPAHVLSPFGFAMAGSALPVNPERLKGAGETAYLNFNNLAGGRDLFRQGVIEQRILLEALTKLEIAPATIASCTGITLPAGATAFRFDGDHVHAQGQSMGGQYTNLVGAVEPRIKAVVPTGAGGFFSHFILITPLISGIADKIALLLAIPGVKLTFMHPGLHVFETAWEAIDPMVSTPRLARRPLPGHPVRAIYEPVAEGDSYFPEATYDAMALAYGHVEAGEVIWPTMKDALALEGHGALAAYPIRQNLVSARAPWPSSASASFIVGQMTSPAST